MSAHTPGPWAVSRNTNLVFGKKQGFGLEPLGFIYGPSFAEDSELGRRALADTRLCAAAPDLLEALVRLSAQCDRLRLPGQSMSDAERAALSAIAKATGERS